MKVIHIIPSIAQVRGGASRAVLDMVKALRYCGVKAEIATTNDDGCNLIDVPLSVRTQYEQVPIYFFSRFSPSIEPIREFAFSAQLTAWLWQNVSHYDLLHIHAIFSYSSTIAMLIARLKGIPYITIPHGLLCQWSLQQSTRKKQIYFNLIERANLNHSYAIHLTSTQEHLEVANLGLSSPSFVLPHGLSIPETISDARQRLRRHLNLSEDEPIILFLSRLHYKKGLDYLIPALGKLNHHRFTFVIAGSGSTEYKAEIESLLVTSGIRDRTYLAGFVQGETKQLFLQGADLFTLTSHSENFGVAVLEALAVGLPVLVTPGVALATVVEQHQLGYVTQLNVSSIVSALDNYLSHPTEAKAMGDRARQILVTQYTWDSIADKLIQVYTNIIENSRLGAKTQSVFRIY